jgi:Nucleotidyl transferase AbiEii toxin, Type IV TA system
MRRSAADAWSDRGRCDLDKRFRSSAAAPAGPIGPCSIASARGLSRGSAASFEQSDTAPKLRFRAPAEDGSGIIRLKVEINTREIKAFDTPQTIRYEVENPWYAGRADIAIFSREELLATKLRALLQRDKGRDLLDLFHAVENFQDLIRRAWSNALASISMAAAGRAADVCETCRAAIHDGHPTAALSGRSGQADRGCRQDRFHHSVRQADHSHAGRALGEDCGYEGEIWNGLSAIQACHLSVYGVLWCIKQRIERTARRSK